MELWTDISDSAPYLIIGYANKQNFIKLLYSNWCHYSPSIPISSNSLITRKNNLIKGKKYWSWHWYWLKIQESHRVNQKYMDWYIFLSAWWNFSGLIFKFKFKIFLWGKVLVFNKNRKKVFWKIKERPRFIKFEAAVNI